jgi:hypothetical protein
VFGKRTSARDILSGRATSAAGATWPGAIPAYTHYISSERAGTRAFPALDVGESHVLGKRICPRKANSVAESPICPGGNPCQEWRADGDCASRRTSTKIATRAGVDNFTPLNCKSNSSQPMASARASGQPLGCYFLNTLAALLHPATTLGFRCGKVGRILLPQHPTL